MEKLTQYRSIAREVIDEYARYKPSYGQSDMAAVYDIDRDHYLLVSFGWNGDRRVYSTILHLRIFEGKLWIERDETEEGVTQDLLDRGVFQKDIVLAFYHYEDRKLTDFAIA
ncbi:MULTISPECIES: XisI protein [Microcoleus]|uniref:XisI protein n=1 Tax=Microcoleus anatoxicus PTRS2 TaxID=2705321 RepID=A0ABU8YRR3_9CYAN|nr:XisI protein [Microcoleus sp. PH2017_28_MFU_U_A]MCC3594878.1 XisI protein [Microcoleus sp. PH2017_28_MFU_U_A]